MKFTPTKFRGQSARTYMIHPGFSSMVDWNYSQKFSWISTPSGLKYSQHFFYQLIG